MRIGNNNITKAYLGTKSLTPDNAFLGLVPLIDDIVPDVWYPFSEDLKLAGKIKSGLIDADGSFYTVTNGLSLEEHGAKVANKGADKGIMITDWNCPYAIFPTARGQYPASDVTLALWVKIDYSEIPAGYGNNRNGALLCTTDSYQYCGLMFEYNEGTNSLEAYTRNRIDGPENVTLKMGKLPDDKWVHLACTIRPSKNNLFSAYRDGILVGEKECNAIGAWCWALQAPNWILSGNARAIRLPFVFRDVRIYGRAIGSTAINNIFQKTKL